MNKAHKELLKQNYAKACEGYVMAFCEMYGFPAEDVYDVHETSGIYSFGDFFFCIEDIRTAVDNEVSEQELFDWYDYNICTGYDKELETITLRAWVRGCPHPTHEEIDRMLKRA